MQFKTKILLLSILTIVIASFTITTLNYTLMANHFKDMDIGADVRIKNAYTVLIDDTKKFYKRRLEGNLRSPGVIEAFKEGDRERLYQLTLPRWLILTEENPYLIRMHYHWKDGRSLLRMHDFAVFGDRISDIRPMLTSAHTKQALHTGYEEGIHGSAFRVIMPIKDGNDYLGLVEFGIDPAYFVEKLKEITGHDTALLLKKSMVKRIYPSPEPAEYLFGSFIGMNIPNTSEQLIKTYSDTYGLAPIKKMWQNNRQFLITTLPLLNYEIKEIGNILFVIDTTEHAQNLRGIVINSILATIVIIIGISLIFQFGFQTLIDKLTFSERFLDLVFNTQQNLVLVTDGENMVHGNDAVHEFFGFSDYEDFKAAHPKICDFFIEDPYGEYLQETMDGMLWCDYILLHPEMDHKVKIDKGGEEHIFSLNAQRMRFRDEQREVIVFTDITKLEKLAQYDQLTGVVNRHSFESTLDKEIAKALRHNYSLSVIYLDIDHFKEVNDNYGHHIGDEVLIKVVEVLEHRLRVGDMLGRWGGEEFIVMLPYTDLDNACNISEQLRQAIEEEQFGTIDVNLTCSFGVTALESGDTLDMIVKRADKALYRSKEAGRNRVDCV